MRTPVEFSDDKLMYEIQSGNVFCFDLIYHKYCSKLYGFVFSILKSKEEAENIIQDVFLIFWQNRLKIEKASSVRTYLFTIAYNSAISVIRNKVKESRFIDYLMTLPETDLANDQIDYDDLNRRLEEIIAILPLRQKEIFSLHKKEGLKYREISERLNISVNTIENHMSAALKTIRKKLGNISYLLF